MIKKEINGDLVTRRSDKYVKLLCENSGELYASPVDLCDQKREELGLPPLFYVETAIPLTEEEYEESYQI